MHTDSSLNGNDTNDLIDDGDDVLLVDTVPVMREDVYVISDDDDLDDESGIGDESTNGTRSMGGAVGTQHRHPE